MAIEIIVSLVVIVAIAILTASLCLRNRIYASKQATIAERFKIDAERFKIDAERFKIDVPLLLKNKRDHLPNSFVPLSRDFLENDYKNYLRLIDTEFFKDFNEM